MKVWITKYALSRGIFEVEVIDSTRGFLRAKVQKLSKYFYYHLHTNDYCDKKLAAIERATKMINRKIETLTNQIVKLQKLRDGLGSG